MKCKLYYKDSTCFKGAWKKAPHHNDSTKIFHRKGGPAIEWESGAQGWYLNGERHREDGPAVECPMEVRSGF